MSNAVKYIFRFLGLFAILYFGTQAVIGITAAGGRFHSDFVARYLDYVSWIKISLMRAAGFFLGIFGIDTFEKPGFILGIKGGRSVLIAYSCVGYGVYSFWMAYVVANKGRIRKKVLWIIGGVSGLWLINSVRITLFLLAINRGWPMPFGLDHHTWFNIFAYLLIFTLIILYDRSLKNTSVAGNQSEIRSALKQEGY